MAALIVAISLKGLKSLEGTELGRLIDAGTVLEDGSREITIDATTDAKLEAARGENQPLADRFIHLVAEARRGEAEAALRGER